MGALPNSQPAGIRYAAYIEELHEFLATSKIPYGSPSDLPPFIAKLERPGTVADDLNSLIRSFILRQGGSMPHAELLEILSLAVGGPELALHPQQHGDSLRQLLRFIAGVQRRPWNVPPDSPGEVVPFPADLSSAGPQPVRRSDPVPVRTAAAAPLVPASRRRAGLWAAVAAVAGLGLIAGGIEFARTNQMRQTEIFHVQPATPSAPDRSVAAKSPKGQPTSIVPAAPAAAAGDQAPGYQPPIAATPAAKPSAYGQILPALNRRPLQQEPGRADRQPGQSNPAGVGSLASQPAHAAGSESTGVAADATPSTVFAPYNPANGATQPPAPIVRQPAYRDPDRYIAGEMPPGGVRRPEASYFTVSSGVMAGNLISSPDPEYPLLARLAHVQGQVTLLVVVAKDGTVEATRVLRGNHLLRSSAEDAVRRFEYRPYRIDGHAVEVVTVVTVDFHDRADPGNP